MQTRSPLSNAEKQKRHRRRKRESVRVLRLPLHADMVASVRGMAGVPEGASEEEAMRLLGEWLEDAAELTD